LINSRLFHRDLAAFIGAVACELASRDNDGAVGVARLRESCQGKRCLARMLGNHFGQMLRQTGGLFEDLLSRGIRRAGAERFAIKTGCQFESTLAFPLGSVGSHSLCSAGLPKPGTALVCFELQLRGTTAPLHHECFHSRT
jgi:hypothetical protein